MKEERIYLQSTINKMSSFCTACSHSSKSALFLSVKLVAFSLLKANNGCHKNLKAK